jgi:hypothetical protein
MAFADSFEIFGKQRVGRPQIFRPEFLHDGTKRQLVFLLCGLRLGERQNRDPKHDRGHRYRKWMPITFHDPSPLLKSAG